MADLNPWYLNYPLAKLKVDPTVKKDFEKLAERYKASTTRAELTDEQLEKFETDVTEWESTQGFRQVNKELADAKKRFIWLNQNKSKYKPEQRAALERDINNQITHAQGTADMYATSGKTRDDIMKQIWAQKKLPPDKRTIDVDKSMSDLSAIVLGEENVRTKNRKLNNFAFTTQALPMDLQKTYSVKLKEITTGQEGWQNVEFDPATGITTTTGVKGITEKSLREINKRIVKNLEGENLRQYKAAWEGDEEEGKGKKSFEDWMMKFLPISLLQKTSKETQKVVKPGTGPAVNETGEVIFTKPTRDFKNKNYGPESTTHQSSASLSLQRLPTINLEITKETTDLKSGNIATDKEGLDFVGESLPTKLLDIDFYPVATEDLRIPKKATRFFGQGYIVIHKEAIISKVDQETIDKANVKAGRMVYKYDEVPYLIKNTLFKQMEVSDDNIKTWGRTNMVPYFKLRDRLINLEGFTPYDEAIMIEYKKRNPFRSEGPGDIIL